MDLNGRERESQLLNRCCTVARSHERGLAENQCEANVFRVAAMIIGPRWRQESNRLLQASEMYFSDHPEQQLHASEVVRKGWIFSFPRLREMLHERLQQQLQQN